MRRRWPIVICLICGCLIGAGNFRKSPPDPFFHGKLLSEWASQLLSPDYTEGTAAAEALKEAGGVAVPHLKSLLRARNSIWQRPFAFVSRYVPFPSPARIDRNIAHERAAMVVADLGGAAKAILPDLIELLPDAEANTRQELERAIRHMGKDGERALSKSLRSRRSRLREAAGKLLNDFSPYARETTKALVFALSDKAPAVRCAAARCLGHSVNEPRIRNALALKSTDPSPAVRAAVAEALGRQSIPSESANLALRKLLSDSDKTVRLEAARGYWNQTKDSSLAVPTLAALLETDRAWQAAYALGEIGESAAPAIPGLIAALRREKVPRIFRAPPSSSFALAQIGPPAIPALTETLKDENPPVRLAAIIALGLMGPKASPATDVLTPLLQDKNVDVRTASAISLAQIGASGDAVIAGLSECLRAEDIYIRSSALTFLTRLAPNQQWVAQSE